MTGRGSIARELPRIARKQLARALDRLSPETPDADAIHEARKSVKQVRAVLRLVRQTLGSAYRSDNRRLRQAAHALSALRDADANCEALEWLRTRYPSVLTPTATNAVAGGLRIRQRQAIRDAGRLLDRARRALKGAAESTPQHIGHAANLRSARAGIGRGYRGARRALEGLGLESEPGRFHLWRRRLKDHWYQIRLFEGRASSPQSRARDLQRLESLLGDDHNLVMLQRLILEAPDEFGDVTNTALVLGCIAKSRVALRTQALKLGHRLFAERPADFDRAVGTW